MKATQKNLGPIKLIGLDLGKKTSNENGQSSKDGGNLWQKFEQENIAGKIPNKTGDERYAVYYDYEGDHTAPFRYFIGCSVSNLENVPDGMDTLVIPSATYKKLTAKGKMPDCIINTWKEIWNSGIRRGYGYDFEIYDERSHDWSDAEIDVYLS